MNVLTLLGLRMAQEDSPPAVAKAGVGKLAVGNLGFRKLGFRILGVGKLGVGKLESGSLFSSWFTHKLRLAAAGVAIVYVSVAAPVGVQAAGRATIDIVSSSGTHPFSVEIADNDEERERGLMFRKELPEGRGMLFDFKYDQPVSFWMHNTYIPLDMIFISGNGRVLRVAENAKPMSDTLIPSGAPVRGVLEVIAGTARKLGIAAGDRVTGSIFGPGH